MNIEVVEMRREGSEVVGRERGGEEGKVECRVGGGASV